jgi:hypothetical protein
VQSCLADGSGYAPCECGAALDARDDAVASAGCLEAGSLGCGLSNRCCADATCIVTVEADGLELSLCASECRTGSDCESNCCAAYDGRVQICAPPDRCQRQACETALDCLSGCCVDGACAPNLGCAFDNVGPSVVGADGAFLGVARSDPGVRDGVCNPSGPYGSSTSGSSIFNPDGPYGSATSALSAYHPSTLTPPILYDSVQGDQGVRVTRNRSFTGGVDPDQLCFFLNARGL